MMRSKTNYIFCLLLFLFSGMSRVYGQIDRTFWFAIPKETDEHGSITPTNNVSLKLAAFNVDAHVKISMPANPAFVTQYVTVKANKAYIDTLATSFPQFSTIYSNNSANGSSAVTGLTNRGLLIESDNDITAYYDYDNTLNRQLFSLKGKNALGQDFYTPFQNIWANAGGYIRPRSIIDIVATHDGTTVTIVPTVIFDGRSDLSTFTVTLDKGQTYSLVAQSKAASDHPAGTHITSDYDIAVTVNDDSVFITGQGCLDIVGDQIVPTNIIGMTYLVMCGNKTTQHAPGGAAQDVRRGEQIFVTGTQGGTNITYKDTAGHVIRTATIGAGQSDYISPDTSIHAQNAIYVYADKPIYVFHITGVGCELGGALLPPITNCTGSNEVMFFRSATVAELTMNIMIPYDTTISFDAAGQSYKFFRIYYSDGSSVAIDPTWFEPVRCAGWATLKFDKRSMSTTLIPMGVAVKVVNTKDYFHLGITNGTVNATNKYGYFSSYNAVSPAAEVATVNQPGIISCFGDTVILKASGGLEYTWHYGDPAGPPTYLSDPASATPRVYCPPGNHTFYVTIHMAKCFGDRQFPVYVTVYPEVKAGFELDKVTGCAPINVTLTNTSSNANQFEWTRRQDLGADIVFTPPVPMSSTMVFNQPNSGLYSNKTNLPITYSFLLKASYNFVCKDSVRKNVTIYPEINANFFPVDTVGCNPVPVNFRNISNGNVNDSCFTWEFGDGGSSIVKDPKHTYYNLFTTTDIVYNVQMVATSPFLCRDTARTTITVHPFIKASFTVDTVQGCSPFTINISNNSLNKGAISQYIWDFGDGTTRATSADTLKHTYPVNFSNSPITYKFLLTVKHNNGTGCPDTLSRLITVYPQTAISFIMNPNKSVYCDSSNVVFTTTSSAAITSYLWDFGDGNTSDVKSPTHLFTNHTNADKTYRVRITGVSNTYCNSTSFKDIVVYPYLDPQFTTDVAKICAPYAVSISNDTRGGVQKAVWDFGDGSPKDSISPGPVITHFFRNTTNDSIIRTINLLLRNDGGCTATRSRNVVLYPEIHSAYNPSAIIGCNPLTVNFTNTSTYVNNAKPVAKYFLWQFNDSSSSSDKNPQHLFVNHDTSTHIYHVKLRTTSIFGCVADTVHDISVYPFMNPDFTVAMPTSCAPFDATITNNSTGGISEYTWNYGDATPVGKSASVIQTHTYHNTNVIKLVRQLKLVIRNSGGCTDTLSRFVITYPEIKANFSPAKYFGCNPFTTTFTNTSTAINSVSKSFVWDFGDSASSTLTKPSHTFTNLDTLDKTYKIKLTAISEYLCSDDTTVEVNVLPYIHAEYFMDNAIGCSPFTAVVNDVSDGKITDYIWNYDDGTLVDNHTSTPYSHTFVNKTSNVAIHQLQLVVSNSNGFCKDTVTLPVTVYPEVNAAFAMVDSHGNKLTEGCNPLTVKYRNNSGPSGVPIEFRWDMSDGSSEGVTNPPDHTFSNINTSEHYFTTRLIAVSQYQCADTLKDSVNVYPYIKAVFSIDSAMGCPTLPSKFTNNTPVGANGFNWDFGNGQYSASAAKTFIWHYTNPTSGLKIYKAKLIVNYNGGCQDTTMHEVTVYPAVTANFYADSLKGCHPLSVHYSNKSTNALSYTWAFGDNAVSPQNSPIHHYYNYSNVDSVYNVTLTAKSLYLCENSLTKTVIVHPKPKARFSVDNSMDCPPFNLKISNISQAANFYNWSFGDGGTLVTNTLGTVNHTYDNLNATTAFYDLVLNASTIYNCTDSMSQTINVYPRVVADFSPDTSGCSPILVPFKNNTVGAISNIWNFGDGFSSKITSPSHKFYNEIQKDTTYKVTLFSYSNTGCHDSVMHRVTVYPQPSARFSALPTPVDFIDNNVSLTNQTLPGDWNYLWKFGDGQTASGKDPNDPSFHTYETWGTYYIHLYVSNKNCLDSISQRVQVNAPMPIAYFDPVVNACEPVTMLFNNKSTTYDEFNTKFKCTYKWDINNKTVSTDKQLTFPFDTAGRYYVKLTVFGDEGLSDAFVRVVDVWPNPRVSFDIEPKLVMLPDAKVKFYNTSSDGDKFLWKFGDNEESTEAEPVHIYTQPKQYYEVSLQVETQHGCVGTKDSLQAVWVLGGGEIGFPNVFAPSITGPSDGRYTLNSANIFHPHNAQVVEFHMEIFDRWGEKLFESSDVNIGWDGYYKGKLCKTDVYIWRAQGKFSNGKTFDKAGDVTLLR